MAINVLIVDDSPMMRSLVGRVLSLSGLEVGLRLEAGNGAEALGVMREHSIDLVFVDINMPVMNGEDLVREMRQQENLRSLPVVVISTDGTTRRIERMKDLGIFGYLQKPFRPEDLRTEVERVLKMPRILPEQINSAIATATGRVLETMCFSCVADTSDAQLNQVITPLGVAVHFSGTLSGHLELWASPQLASSLAMNFLGSADDASNAATDTFMLNELANMICGATLTQLYGEGDFSLEGPIAVAREPDLSVRGQHIESDDGSMWVFFEVGPNRWRAEAQYEC
jgi:two-component system chemotaxis response regulator CheY